MAKKTEVDGRSIEEKLKRLEEISHLLDEGTLPLEEQLKIYEEGIKLASSCRAYIEKAQAKVALLSRVLLEPGDATSTPE